MSTLSRQLKAVGACEDAVGWAKDYESLRAAWAVCERGDWMLWLCGRMQGQAGWPDRKQLVAVACDCAELVLPIYEKKYSNDNRVRNCIEVTRAWVAGNATIEDVRNARNAAYSAAYATSAAAATTTAYAAAATAYAAAAATTTAYAADATAYAAAATTTTAYAAYATTYAATTTAYAAYAAYADADAARMSTYNQCAGFCRARLTIPDKIERA